MEIEKRRETVIEQCGKRCDNNTNCKSIEWSDSTKMCVLLMAEYTDGPNGETIVFVLS